MYKELPHALAFVALAGILAFHQPLLTQNVQKAAQSASQMPMYAIAGTDPRALAEEAPNLADIATQLASLQSESTDKKAVRDLYPTRFLLALSHAETKRLEFLASPSIIQRESYIGALYAVTREKQHSLEQFIQSWDAVFGTSTPRLITFGGSIDMSSARATLLTLQAGMALERTRLASYVGCLRGGACMLSQAMLSSAPAATVVERKAGEAELLWREVHGNAGSTATALSFEKSVCLDAQPGPYPMRLSFHEVEGVARPFLSYVGDIYFVSTHMRRAPVLVWERENLGMQYTPLNPFNFYTCPELGIDLSEALTAHASSTQSVPAGELALMRTYKTAGLQFLTHDIARMLAKDIQNLHAGAPFDFSAKHLFLAYSSFPSFFRVGAEPSALLGLRRHDSRDQENFFSTIIPYSVLRHTAPRETLVNDMRTFLKFEN